jgi:hypothetical protein
VVQYGKLLEILTVLTTKKTLLKRDSHIPSTLLY